MVKKISGLMAASVLAIASGAFAGPPLPPLVFPDGGFVPDSATELRIDQRGSSALSALIKSTAKCIEKGVGDDFKNDPDTAIDLNACRTKAMQQYQAAMARLNRPACQTPAIVSGVAAEAINHLDLVSAAVFCDGAPSAATGLNRPSSRDTLVALNVIWRAFGRAYTQGRKCYDSTVKALFKSDSDALSDHEECQTKALNGYDAKASKPVIDGITPVCLPPASVPPLGVNTVEINSDNTTGEFYCDP